MTKHSAKFDLQSLCPLYEHWAKTRAESEYGVKIEWVIHILDCKTVEES